MLPADLWTPDPLGIGGLLRDALRADRLRPAGALDARLPDRLIAGALTSLEAYGRSGELYKPASHRLGFRELGLAIGLAGVPALIADASSAAAPVAEELAYPDLGDRIEALWLWRAHRSSAGWLDHRNINDVTLATRLLPDPVA